MKKQYINIILCLLIVVFAGCDKGFLDIKPKGKVIPQTTDDYRKILDFVVQSNVGEKNTILRTYGIADYLADDFQIADQTANDALETKDTYMKYNWAADGFLYAEDKEDVDWQTLYSKVYIANSVLDGVPNASGSEQDKSILIAEAKVHRAFAYLALVNIYAKHYSASADTDLGVPLRLGILLTASLERATVQEVYDQILLDLEEAVNDLPNTSEFNHRPTKAATYGLLSRVYLYMGDYATSLTNADLCLGITNSLYDYNTVEFKSFTAWDDVEIILQKSSTTRTANNTSYQYGYQTTSADLVENLMDTTNDLRYALKFRKDNNGGYTFRENGNRWSWAYYPMVGVTVPEIMLTRAECIARTASYTTAMQDVNTIRENRYLTGTYTPVSPSNTEEALDIILNERRLELWGRGLRWFDLKRLNAIENANITITRLVSGQQLTPGDDHWVMPIARLYISQNPEIVQNPGYSN